MDEEKIRELIARNELHIFYGSQEWRTLAETARTRQHNECQRCKAKGFYSACEAVHHKQYLRKHPELALDVDNLECLCRDCHEQEHARKKYYCPERW